MTPTRTAATVLVALCLAAGLSACEKEKGPAEKLGAKLDNAASEMKSAADEAKAKLEEAAENAKKELEDE